MLDGILSEPKNIGTRGTHRPTFRSDAVPAACIAVTLQRFLRIRKPVRCVLGTQTVLQCHAWVNHDRRVGRRHVVVRVGLEVLTSSPGDPARWLAAATTPWSPCPVIQRHSLRVDVSVFVVAQLNVRTASGTSRWLSAAFRHHPAQIILKP